MVRWAVNRDNGMKIEQINPQPKPKPLGTVTFASSSTNKLIKETVQVINNN